jgi:hypothetical protein
MKPKQLVTALVFSLLATACFAQRNIARRVMAGDSSLVLFKRAETQKYIIAAVIDRATKMVYLLDRNGNTWDSLRMQPYDCNQVLRHNAGPFDYYLAAQRQIRAYRNELIRQLREKSRLDPASLYYEAALYEHPELQNTDSATSIKGILTLERENRRDSTYSWGATCDEPGSFVTGSTYVNKDANQPGDSYTRCDTLIYINSEITSRVHRAVLINKAGSLDYYDRDGLKIWSFKLNPKSIAQLSKTDVFTYYLEYLEKSKQSIDRQVRASVSSSNVQYASLKQPGGFNLAEDQRLIEQQLDYATAPDLKNLATRLKEASGHTAVNGQWLSFLGFGSYTPPASWDSVGTRRYELTDQRENVLVTVTDKRISIGGYFLPDVSTAQDYYAFGALMPGRSFKVDSNYRYGYNGQEKSNEISGNGNHNTAEFWEYDTRVGRRWNKDVIAKPWESSYATFAGNPISFADPDGADTITFINSTWSAATQKSGLDNQPRTPISGSHYSIDLKIAPGEDVFYYTRIKTIYDQEGNAHSSTSTVQFDPSNESSFSNITQSSGLFGWPTAWDNDQMALGKLAPNALLKYLANKDQRYQSSLYLSSDAKFYEGLKNVTEVGITIYGNFEIIRGFVEVASLRTVTNILENAAQGDGNFGLGTATHDEAMMAGRNWVGDGYRVASDGKTLISKDGLRQFRPPSFKPRLNMSQANFESREVSKGQWLNNGHVDIIK